MAISGIQHKRFDIEKKLLAKEPLHYTTAYPDKGNPLIWYCLIVGQKGTPYHGGHYIYKIVHSPKYPAEPPDYYFLTPCGRYSVEKKICLTNSSYHKGEWSSSWNIKTILISFYSVFLDDKEHGISHIVPSEENTLEMLNNQRIALAKKSIEYNNTHWKTIYSGFDTSHLFDDTPNVPLLVKPTVSSDAVASTHTKPEEVVVKVEPKEEEVVVKVEPKEEVKVEPKEEVVVKVEPKEEVVVKVKRGRKKKAVKLMDDTE
jgi:ubiquitin-protein ligase